MQVPELSWVDSLLPAYCTVRQPPRALANVVTGVRKLPILIFLCLPLQLMCDLRRKHTPSIVKNIAITQPTGRMPT